MTHFRTLHISELFRLPRATRLRLQRNIEGAIVVDERGTIGAIVSPAIVERDFSHLQCQSFRLSKLSDPTSPILAQSWLTEGADLIWLTSNRRPVLALVHSRHKKCLPIPTFRVGGVA